jgi:ribonuclease J
MPIPSDPGIYWQSRMGNNRDGIGGNCHRYDIVRADAAGAVTTLVVDFGIKIHNGDSRYSCSFADPEGLFPRRGGGDGRRAADALLLTHCHEDHIGALRHAIDMGYRPPPIHCTAFTAEMLGKSLLRAGIIDPDQRPALTIVAPGETVAIGGAEVTFVAMDHLPGAAALLLRSPDAAVFHTGDYKFDATLPLGSRADAAFLRRIGRDGVDMVVSDSTAAGDTAAKVSEAEIERNLTRLLAGQRDRAVIAGVLGSQLDRLVSLGRAATANGRAVIVAGASLCENVKAAERAGISCEKAIGAPLLMAPDGANLTADRALVVTTGAFAQPQAGLTRAAEAQPGALYVDAETTILIPQRAIPPIADARREMIERLQAMGARVITAEDAPALGYGAIHQSGHAVAADARLLYSLLKPKRCVSPMHGAPQQIAANGQVAESLGIRSVQLPENGAVLRIDRRGSEIVAREALPRIAAAETGLVKQLPRAKPGEGRRPSPPPAVYRYDRLDDHGAQVTAANIAPCLGPTRRPGRSAGGRAS